MVIKSAISRKQLIGYASLLFVVSLISVFLFQFEDNIWLRIIITASTWFDSYLWCLVMIHGKGL